MHPPPFRLAGGFNPGGVGTHFHGSQGRRSCVAPTLGWMMERRWRSASRSETAFRRRGKLRAVGWRRRLVIFDQDPGREGPPLCKTSLVFQKTSQGNDFPSLENESPSLGNDFPSLGNESPSLGTQFSGVGIGFLGVETEVSSVETEFTSQGNESPGVGTEFPRQENESEGVGRRFPGVEIEAMSRRAEIPGAGNRAPGGEIHETSHDSPEAGKYLAKALLHFRGAIC